MHTANIIQCELVIKMHVRAIHVHVRAIQMHVRAIQVHVRVIQMHVLSMNQVMIFSKYLTHSLYS